MNETTLTRIRFLSFAATGVTCVVYAFLALVLGKPDPIPAWVPGLLGGLTGLFGAVTAFISPRISNVVWDELSREEWARAVRSGFWIALGLYPIAGLLLAQGVFTHAVLFAAMGTLTGAAPLLWFCWLDLRGR